VIVAVSDQIARNISGAEISQAGWTSTSDSIPLERTGSVPGGLSSATGRWHLEVGRVSGGESVAFRPDWRSSRMRPSRICSFAAARSRVARHERRVLNRKRFAISVNVKPIV